MALRDQLIGALCAALLLSCATAQSYIQDATAQSPGAVQTTGCYAATACGQEVAYSTSLYKLINNTWVLVYPCQCTDGRQIVVNEQGQEVLKVSTSTTAAANATAAAANTTAASAVNATAAAAVPSPSPATAAVPAANVTGNATTAVVRFNYVVNADGTATYQTWDLPSWIETLIILTGGVEKTPCTKVNVSALPDINVDACRSNIYGISTICTQDCRNLVTALGANCAAALNKKVPGFFNFPDPEASNTTLTYAIQQCIEGEAFTAKPGGVAVSPAAAPSPAASRKLAF